MTGLGRLTDCMQCVSVCESDITSVPHLQVESTEAEGADMALNVEFWICPRFGLEMGKCSPLSSLSPTPPETCWICVWGRLARELRGYPWDLQGCFPKIASDIHYEQLTKAINSSLQLSPLCPPSFCQENI